MIGRLKGEVVERDPEGSIVLDVRGVGYELFVPAGAHGRVVADGSEVTLSVHTHVREDAITLFGFESQQQRRVFRALLSVSSIGPKLALAILGRLSPGDLAAAVARDDKAAFKGIPGVGRKTIERILIDLKDKLRDMPIAGPARSAPVTATTEYQNGDAVVSALIQLGYRKNDAEQALTGLGDASPDSSVESLLREALARLS